MEAHAHTPIHRRKYPKPPAIVMALLGLFKQAGEMIMEGLGASGTYPGIIFLPKLVVHTAPTLPPLPLLPAAFYSSLMYRGVCCVYASRVARVKVESQGSAGAVGNALSLVNRGVSDPVLLKLLADKVRSDAPKACQLPPRRAGYVSPPCMVARRAPIAL